MNEKQISVVIPARNESTTIGTLVQALLKNDDVGEVIVVNDGSTDDTSRVARSAGARVLDHRYSRGNGAAIKSGARAATTPWIAFMDADGQHRAEDLPRLVDRARASNADMVVGSRDRAGQASRARHIANALYNWFASAVTRFRIRDLTSGFRLVKRSLFMEFLHLLPNQFSYPTTITMAFIKAGYAVEFEPITVLKRTGKSHIRPLRDGIRFVIIIFKIATLYSPLKVFAPLAALHFAMGLAWYAYTYTAYSTFTNMSALLMVTGVQIFMIGLVSEQISTLLYRPTDGNGEPPDQP